MIDRYKVFITGCSYTVTRNGTVLECGAIESDQYAQRRLMTLREEAELAAKKGAEMRAAGLQNY
jgi:hypothetical protein